MTTTTDNNESMNLDAPDLKVMDDSIKAMHQASASADVAFNTTKYLPDLYAITVKWVGNATSSRAALGKTCRAIGIRLELSIRELKMFNAQLAEISEPEELEDMYDEVKKSHAGALDAINTEAKALALALSNINQTFDSSQTKLFLQALGKDADKVVADIENLESAKAKLDEQRAVLTAGIDALESKGIIDTAQDVILTTEKVAAMGLQPPEAALIELALEQMKKTLENAKAAMNFLSLISARDVVVDHINVKSAAIASLKLEKSLIAQRVTFINAAHELDAQQRIFATEVKKVITSINSFLALNKYDLKNVEDDTVQFINDASALTNYLKLIS